MRLTGKVAIVTGAATGIGRAIAKRFVEEGAAVVVDYVGKPDAAEEFVGDLTAAGGKSIAFAADVSQQDQVGHLVEAAVKAFGRLDIVVNNAGVWRRKPRLSITRRRSCTRF